VKSREILVSSRCLWVIVAKDFPQEWDLLPDQIKALIQSDSYSEILTGLNALKLICKVYQYSSEEDRNPFNKVIDLLFPLLEDLILKHEQENSIEASHIKCIISQILEISNTMYTLKRYSTQDEFRYLLSFFISNLKSKLDPEMITPLEDIDEMKKRGKDPRWKIR
jgi:hypothetical protein